MRNRKPMLGLGAIAAVVGAALVAPGAVVTTANWTDTEWNSAPIGTVDCADADGSFLTRATGRALSGALLGIDLDTVVAASGVTVSNDGQQVQVIPASAQPAPHDPGGAAPAFSDPLRVRVLQDTLAIDLTEILQLPLGNPTGILGQYAASGSDGKASSASGYVTESGGIATNPGAGYPNLATVQLSNLLGALNYNLGELLPDVTDASLEIGAVTGRAHIDGCSDVWEGVAQSLVREYLATSLDLLVESPTIGELTGALDDVVEGLEDTVNGLADDEGVIDQLTGAVNALVGDFLLSGLGLGDLSLTLNASVDTTAVRDLINPSQPIRDASDVLAVDLATGVVAIDTVALLQEAYPDDFSNGLNGLAPNTNILNDDPAVLTALTDALSGALGDWLDQITGALDEAIDLVQVELKVILKLEVSVLLTTTKIGTVTADLDASLGDLLAGGVEADVVTDLSLGLLGSAVKLLIEPLVNNIVAGLVNDLGATVGGVLEETLGPLRVLPATITQLTSAVIEAVSGLYSELFLSGLVAVDLNSQNDTTIGGSPPADWAALPAGRYDVAALRIGVLDALGAESVQLYLGRANVGPVCAISAPYPCAGT